MPNKRSFTIKEYFDLQHKLANEKDINKKNSTRAMINKMLKFKKYNEEYTTYELKIPLLYRGKRIEQGNLIAISRETKDLIPYLYFDNNKEYQTLKIYKSSTSNQDMILYDKSVAKTIDNIKNDSGVDTLKIDVKQYNADNNEYKKKRQNNIYPSVPHNILSYKNIYSKYLSHKTKTKDDILCFIRRNFKVYEKSKYAQKLNDFNIKKYAGKNLRTLEFVQKYNKLI